MTSVSTVSWWRKWWMPVLLVAVGFLVRTAYYNEGYGHPDETITVEVVNYMRRSGDWDTNWAKARLEPTLRYDQYNFSSHLYATFFFYRIVKLVPGLGDWRSLDGGFWVYRFFSVLLASLTVWQTWWLARRVSGDLAAMLAGALVVVAPLLVHDAHYMRSEAFVTVLTLAAVGLCLPEGKIRLANVFGAALLVGLLVACKVSMLALAWLPLVPVAAALVASPNKIAGRPLWLGGLLTIVGLALGFFLGAPGAVLHPQVFRHGFEHLATQYAGLHPPYSHVDGGMVVGMLAGYFRATFGWPALLAGAIGATVLLVQRRWWEGTLLAGPVLLFVGYFATRSVFFERNLSHIVPLFCILAGIGVASCSKWLAVRVRKPMPWVAAALGLVLIARPAEVVRRLDWIEFSGRGAERHNAFEDRLKAKYPGAKWWNEEALLNEEPLSRLAAHFNNGGTTVLLGIVDYHDEWSARYGPHLPEQFDAELLAVYPSEFSDIPGCTLHTYNSWTNRYYLVRGPRPAGSSPR